jgi:hypothetical protein
MTAQDEDRFLELLADRALDKLTPAEEQELARIEVQSPGRAFEGSRPSSSPSAQGSIDEMERAAAAVMLASLPAVENMPAHLLARVHDQSEMAVRREKRRRDPVRYTGWVAAAACLAFALGSLLMRPRLPSGPSAAQAYAELAAQKETQRLDWSATKDPAATKAGGEVLWNPVTQKGFMRFRGLAMNDKQREQYQLWIFDGTKDDRYPVDGGVFDVGGEDVIVPITAKIAVGKATLFAVTVEKPGGVVVSKRERIVVTAKPAA